MLEQPLTMQASSQQPVMQFTSSPAYEWTSQITPLDPVSSSHSIDQLDHSDFSLQSSLTSNVSISVSHLDNSDSSFSIDQLNHSESSHYSSLSSVSIPVGELDQSDSSRSICQLDSESFCHSSSLDTHIELPNSSDLSSPANCQRQPSESNLFSSFSSTPSSSNSNLSNLNPEDSDHQSDCDEIYPTLVDIDESFLDPLYPGAKVSLLAALYLIMQFCLANKLSFTAIAQLLSYSTFYFLLTKNYQHPFTSSKCSSSNFRLTYSTPRHAVNVVKSNTNALIHKQTDCMAVWLLCLFSSHCMLFFQVRINSILAIWF